MDFRRRDILAAAAILIMAQRRGRADIIGAARGGLKYTVG
jgi:hypothetical protein